MAEEQNELRQVNWSEIFSFTQIFKSFKMAIHPSKLVLSLATIVLIGALGVGMDKVWGLFGGNARSNEISAYVVLGSVDFKKAKEQWNEEGQLRRAVELRQNAENEKNSRAVFPISRSDSVGGWGQQEDWNKDLIAAEFTKIAGSEAIEPSKAPSLTLKTAKDTGVSCSTLISQARADFEESQKRIARFVESAEVEAKKNLEKNVIEANREKAREKMAKDYDAAKRGLITREIAFKRSISDIEGRGVFCSLLEWEMAQLHNAVKAVWAGNIRGGMSAYTSLASKNNVAPATTYEVPSAGQIGAQPEANGFVYYVLMAIQGFMWLFSQHTLYGLVFVLVGLAIVAIFGGAVHRIAAMHFAREEKISIAQALKFSMSKFLSFYTAPLIPLAIIAVLSVVLWVAGLCFSIPVLDVVVSVLAFLAIIIGMLVAFMSIGLVAGSPLMYPTIAMEGSDSFDAISRSFSYVFSRPWRAVFYGLVALVYGVVTYLFVRAFAFIALATTHCLIKTGVQANGAMLGEGATKLDVVWTAPTFWSLLPAFSWPAMSGLEKICAAFIIVWVFLVAASVLAFLLSFAASATTSIYALLRRHVDATDLDDVYVEEASEPVPAAAPAAAPVEAPKADEEKKS